MDIELIDKAWACLPREFKEEVKRLYRIAESDVDQMIAMIMLENVFGGHNLTSDAEGEELLTCEKSKAMQLYSHLLDLVENERISEHCSEWCDLEREYIALFGENVFADYFGSKCLPDAHEDNFTRTEPKPSEPKEKSSNSTELKSQEVDKHFDAIIKDGFREHNRLHIAAMIMSGLLASGKEKHPVGRALDLADALIAEAEKGEDNA